MKRVAIVEDNLSDAKLLKEYIDRFARENDEPCEAVGFNDGLDFIGKYKPHFDVVLMDIEMPFINGIDTARKLREIDKAVCIIFITNMSQFAIKGYEVSALDFIVKPVTYFNFASKLKRAFAQLPRKQEKKVLIAASGDNVINIPISDIIYLEKEKNYIVLHTRNGIFKKRGAMKQMEEELSGCGFLKNTSGSLVNLNHVVKITRSSVFAGNEELPISRQQRKEFIGALMQYFSEGAGKP